jgi:hypothetical protein
VKRLRIIVLAVLAMIVCAALTHKAIRRFRRPFRAWWVDPEQWYDEALGAALYAVIAGACVAYLYRIGRRQGQETEGPSPAADLRWRDRIELRVVLYFIAVWQIGQLPLGVFKAVEAFCAPRPYWDVSLWSLIPIASWIWPPVGIAIIVYDRRRIRREWREEAGHCLRCGYDLRASSERCPECGTRREPARNG